MKRDARAKAQLVENLRKHFNVKAACVAAGIGRATFYRWYRDDDEFADECRKAEVEGRDDFNDLMMVKFQQLVRDGNAAAVIFGLRRMHPYFREHPSFVLPDHADEFAADVRKAIVSVAKSMLRRGMAGTAEDELDDAMGDGAPQPDEPPEDSRDLSAWSRQPRNGVRVTDPDILPPKHAAATSADTVEDRNR
jgi:AcrR family transcriptional regulator